MRMLAGLAPNAKPKFELFLRDLDTAIGEDRYIVYEGHRTRQVQEAYYAQGRETLDKVNVLRKAAGLYLLKSEKDNYTITWTLKSKHIDGLAMDVLPVDGRGNPTWDLAHYRKTFEDIRNCGRAAGLDCGADWPEPKRDWPHYEVA
jgi:hypothetical protein